MGSTSITVVLAVVESLSHVQVFLTLWTVACQAPLSVGLSRRDYWSGSPFPPPGDLPNPGIEPLNSHLLLGRQILDYWAAWEPRYHHTHSQIHKVFDIKSES